MRRLVSSLSFFMKIAIIQPDTFWEDKKSNLNNIKHLIGNLSGKPDVVVLSEMFSTGFTLNAESLAEETNGETLRWMAALSSRGNFAICGSLIIKFESRYYNRFYFVTPEGEFHYYDKRHLFSLARENRIYTSGKSRKIISFKNVRFLPVICYDLRFPVWCRNSGDYDILVCIASWPEIRREAWNCLLKARAIENQCFVVGVNRTGVDNEGLKYIGDSIVIDFLGRTICRVDDYTQGIAIADISVPELVRFREQFPVWKDSDNFMIKL